MDQKPQSLRKERQAKREIRRQQQRAASVARAEKMGAARLEAKSSLKRELTCPSAGDVKGGSFYVGCSGWYYWQWRGRFYPADMPANEWLAHYMSKFRTVELNAPFYAWPTIATVKTWRRQVGRKKFRYSVKVSDLITHVHRFKGTGELVKSFGHIANLLGESMGCFLFQLPRDYEYTAANLRAILSQLDPQRRNVVEFRHPSWWKERVFKAFRETGTIFCSLALEPAQELLGISSSVALRSIVEIGPDGGCAAVQYSISPPVKLLTAVIMTVPPAHPMKSDVHIRSSGHEGIG